MTPADSNATLTPRPAATVALVREAGDDFEVLMVQRNLESVFVAGAYVFPGGAVDAADHGAEMQALCRGVNDESASRSLNLPSGGLAYLVAAIRECFEECGLLLAYAADDELVELDAAPVAQRYADYRNAIYDSEESFFGMCSRERLRLAADRLTYFGHWITPAGAPRRYDTRFFFALAPRRQQPLHDERETIAHAWLTPRQALERHRSGAIKMRGPTVKTLEMFARAGGLGKLIESLRAPREIPTIRPVYTRNGWLVPGDPGYEQAIGVEPR